MWNLLGLYIYLEGAQSKVWIMVQVELIILAHFYYESSACLDGIDVLVSLAATRVDSYVAEGDYALLARLVTGLSNFQRLRFILDVLVEHGCLQLLLQKKAVFDAAVETSVSIRAFCMAVLTALKHFNPYDHDALLLVLGLQHFLSCLTLDLTNLHDLDAGDAAEQNITKQKEIFLFLFLFGHKHTMLDKSCD